jgi:hypothetical protein
LTVKTQCSVNDCTNQAIARNLCKKHYQRWKRYGDPLFVPRAHEKRSTCIIDGCEKKPEPNMKGYCRSHYYRLKRYKDPFVEIRTYSKRNQHCIIEDCNSPVKARGMCEKHYCRWRRAEFMTKSKTGD